MENKLIEPEDIPAVIEKVAELAKKIPESEKEALIVVETLLAIISRYATWLNNSKSRIQYLEAEVETQSRTLKNVYRRTPG